MTSLETSMLIDSVVTLLTEAYAGPSNPNETWFIDNAPDSGLLGVLAGVTAAEASTPVGGAEGPTIAANVEHLRWSLANANGAMRGQPYNPDWSESWRLSNAGEAEWNHLRQALRSEFESICATLQEQQQELRGPYLNGVLALIPHAAYHLGMIRQMIERLR